MPRPEWRLPGGHAGAGILTGEMNAGRGRPGRLIGRRRELAALIRTIEGTAVGSGRAVWIAGPSGIGKTRLITEATRYAAWRGLRCLVQRPPLSAAEAAALFRSPSRGDRDPRWIVLEDARDRLGLPARSLPSGACLIASGEDASAIPRDLAALRPQVLSLGGLSHAEAIELVRRHGRRAIGLEAERSLRALAGHPGRLIGWARASSEGPSTPRPSP